MHTVKKINLYINFYLFVLPLVVLKGQCGVVSEDQIGLGFKS